MHIEYLLLRRDCVVVPGIGAFINVRHGANFDAALGAWRPMTREVRFNRALTHDDGLLANSYARKSRSSFEDGRDMLHGDIAEIQRALNAGGSIVIGNLGTLRMEDETLRFVPAHSAEELSAIYGYEPAPIVRRTQQESTADKGDGVVATAASSADSGGRKFDTRRNYYIAINKVFARVAACVTAVLLVGLSAMIPVSDCNRADQASVVPVEKIIRATARHIAAPVAADTASKAMQPKAAEEQEAKAEELRYHAIVATFNTEAEAEEYVEQHSSDGFDLSVLTTRTRSRVSAASSDNREEVRRAMASPDFQKNFSQAWIWEKE